MKLGHALALSLAALAVGAVAVPSAQSVESRAPVRGFPDTSRGIHVFEDQLADPLTPGLLRFAATHYDGSQKQRRSMVDALHGRNPAFMVLQYRLGLGLGYRASATGCNHDGDWLYVIDGDRWVREWPSHPDERWLFHRNGHREYMCDWGWYLTNPDSAAWRNWFLSKLRGQVTRTHADGVFLDSVSVPNEFGASAWDPPLPAVDAGFERAWSRRIERWLPVVRSAVDRPVVVNAGSWITTRDVTNYSGASGVMIEGCAQPSSGGSYAPEDWVLQANRVIGLVRLGRIVICQAYPDPGDVRMRMFVLGTSLLWQGAHTFLNLEIGMDPEWFPEYGIDLGAPVGPLPSTVAGFRHGGVYVRRFERGRVVVNPTESTHTVTLPGTMFRVVPHGGGFVPPSGTLPATWKLSYAPVDSVTLGPRDAVVLLMSRP